MIHGVGVDILSLERIAPMLQEEDDPFFRVYTPAERAEAKMVESKILYYAGRFAAKEAVFKSLGMDGDRARLNEIETLRGEFGQPLVTLHGALADLAREKGISSVHLSLSNEPPYVIAYAISEG